MRLSAAAKYFDKLVCTDAYGTATFKAQLDLYDDARREGLTVQRRILSVAPGVSAPARKVVTFSGEQWIIGDNESDSFNGQTIRVKHIVHRAGGLASLQTPGQALSAGGTAAYAAKSWVKDFKDVEATSVMESLCNLYLASTEVVPVGTIVTFAGHLYRARNSFLSIGGFLEVESSDLPEGIVAGTYRVRTGYSPSTDTETIAVGTAVQVLRVRWQDDFNYANPGADKYEPGDLKGLVRKAVVTVAAPGDHLVLADGTWRVLAVESESDCWGLHLRRV